MLGGDGRPRRAGRRRSSFFNFRPDRVRQICHALLPTLGLLVTMTRYDDDAAGPVAFETRRCTGRSPMCSKPPASRQLHVAETEKYPT